MSRIGNLPIEVPEGVEITISDANEVKVKGSKGELTQQVDPVILVKLEDGQVVVSRSTDEKDHRSKHGLYRSLINNMIIGVTKGYEIKQELVGVGYRAQASGQKLEMSLGFSHSIVFQIPNEVKVSTVSERGQNPIITLESIDKQLVGAVASKIRSLRKPEPYKGKGIKYVGEQLRRKAGKSAAK